MIAEQMARRTGQEHTSAVRRLAGAQDEQSRLGTLFNAAVGTTAEPLALERLSAARAYVAARKEWLHWINEGQSFAPWADGDWAPESARPAYQRRSERRPRSTQGQRGILARLAVTTPADGSFHRVAEGRGVQAE